MISNEVQVAIAVSIAPTIIALGTLVVGWRNSSKTDAIHSMVDGNLTAVKKDLALQVEHTKKLEEMLLKMTNASPIIVEAVITSPPATIPLKKENP